MSEIRFTLSGELRLKGAEVAGLFSGRTPESGGPPLAAQPDVLGRAADALERAVEAWIPDAMLLATRLTGNAHDAEDLVQTSLLKAARGISSYRGESSVETWLYRILVNAHRDRPKLRISVELTDAVAARPVQADASELSALVDAAIACLPERQREAMLLSRTGLNSNELAEALGTTPANARKLVQLAREKLRERLKDHL